MRTTCVVCQQETDRPCNSVVAATEDNCGNYLSDPADPDTEKMIVYIVRISTGRDIDPPEE